MRPKSLLLLTLALGCGLVASIGISQVLDRSNAPGPAAEESEVIYIAKSDINLGDAINEEVLNLEEWPKDKVPPGAIRDFEELVGRRPKTKIYRGEPILEVKLIAADARDNPADQVPPGYRVVSVRVDSHTGGAGLLRPGDRVDVQLYAKKDPRIGLSETTTKTILKEIRVFAVDQDFRRAAQEDDKSPARTVSLVVTPRQADKLTLAARLGEINLIMRNPDDTTNEDEGGATAQDIFASIQVDRKNERGLVDDGPSTGSAILKFLGDIANAANTATVAEPVVDEPWTIIILEGENVREVKVREGEYEDAFLGFRAPKSSDTASPESDEPSDEEDSGESEWNPEEVDVEEILPLFNK